MWRVLEGVGEGDGRCWRVLEGGGRVLEKAGVCWKEAGTLRDLMTSAVANFTFAQAQQFSSASYHPGSTPTDTFPSRTCKSSNC